MSDFVRDLEAELLAAARRRTARARRWSRRRPPALVAAVAVAAALIAVALLPRAGAPSASVAPAQARTCTVFPDASLLLRDAPCTSNPFGQ
jgi:hypothetical protein